VLYRYLPEYSRGATTDVSPYRYMQAVTYRVRPGREGEFMDLSRTFQDALKKVRPDSVWAMFELVAGADEGTYLVMLPMKNLAGLADDPALKKALMAALGPDGAQKFQKTAAEVLVSSTVTLFAFNPAMSSVAPIFAKADPWWAWKAAAAAKTETAPSKPADMTKPAAVPVKK
jgi:hypothetical protein